MSKKVSKAAPKGVSEEKYKRCKEKVKRQSPGVNEYAVCASSLEKSEDEIKMKRKDFIKEHKNLVQVLRSDDRKAHKKEAEEQESELKEQTKKSVEQRSAEHPIKEMKDYPKSAKQIGCGTGLAGKICRHNAAKLNKSPKEFVKDRMKKSYDFRDSLVSISSVDQMAAEQTVDKGLVEYLKANMQVDLNKIPFAKGILTLNRKEKGLFSGFFQDKEGQIIEKFDDLTLAMIAKTMEVKELYDATPAPAIEVSGEHPDKEQDEELIHEALEHHNALYHQGQAPGEPINAGKGHVKIKYSNFELEIKKSINDFVKSFKSNKKMDLNKAISSWRRNSKVGNQFSSNIEAAKKLLEDWDDLKEEFNQILYFVDQNE